jgi:hypothetical protein
MDITKKGMGVPQQPAVQPAPVVAERLSVALIRPNLQEATFKKSPYGRTAASQQRAKELLNPPKPPEPKKDEKDVEEAGKKKSRNKNKLSKYFFPGYGYYGYGGSNDSGEGGGNGGGEGVNEFAPGGGDDGDADPYRYPKPTQYSHSVDFFGQFEADHFDHEDFDDAAGVFKGYQGRKQIAYFKFDNPEKTGSDDPGMGWYYEPDADSDNNNASNKPYVDNSKQRKQQELAIINAFLKSGQTPKPGSQIYGLMKRHGLAEAGSPAQQAAIAIAMKKAGKKPKSEAMLPKSAFAGSDKNKLGSAGQLKGSMKRPARAGDLVGGGAEESIQHGVKVSEGVETIMDSLINKIIANEAIQNNKR